MFNVPVLEVAVSSAPVFVENIHQVSEISVFRSQGLSAFLSAAAVLPKSGSLGDTQLDPVFESLPAAVAQSKTLLPNRPFQLLKPLDLAGATAALENVFTPSLVLSMNLNVSNDTDDPLAGSLQPTDQPATAIELQTVELESLSPSAPVTLRQELYQCVDIDKPQDISNEITFQVRVKGISVGRISSYSGAEQVVSTLQELLTAEHLNPNEIVPVLDGKQPVIQLSDHAYLELMDNTTAFSSQELRHEWAAIAWSDQLRKVLGGSPLDAGDVQVGLQGLKPSEQSLGGIASWYGPYFHGRLTANGETFDQTTLTAAHKTLPFNTVLQVRNLKNNQTVVVRINDRGPYIGKRSLDLSKAAAQCLDGEHIGVIPYEAIILETPDMLENQQN